VNSEQLSLVGKVLALAFRSAKGRCAERGAVSTLKMLEHLPERLGALLGAAEVLSLCPYLQLLRGTIGSWLDFRVTREKWPAGLGSLHLTDSLALAVKTFIGQVNINDLVDNTGNLLPSKTLIEKCPFLADLSQQDASSLIRHMQNSFSEVMFQELPAKLNPHLEALAGCLEQGDFAASRQSLNAAVNEFNQSIASRM